MVIIVTSSPGMGFNAALRNTRIAVGTEPRAETELPVCTKSYRKLKNINMRQKQRFFNHYISKKKQLDLLMQTQE